MGEPFREGSTAAGLNRWFAAADRDGDQGLTLGEVGADSARFFAFLDVDGNGEIGPVEINRYEREIAPEIQIGGWAGRRGLGKRGGDWRRRDPDRYEQGGRGPSGRRMSGGSFSEYGDTTGLQGAGRYSLINIPEPVIDADSDLNRGVSRDEFASFGGTALPAARYRARRPAYPGRIAAVAPKAGDSQAGQEAARLNAAFNPRRDRSGCLCSGARRSSHSSAARFRRWAPTSPGKCRSAASLRPA